MSELARYIVNGLFATAIHFAVLTFNLKLLHIPYAGVANLIAAVFGIATSFIGSRYFVFKGHQDSLRVHFIRFTALYVLIAMLHGLILLIWTDWWSLDYRIGFLLATTMQVSISYFGNKKLVFKV